MRSRERNHSSCKPSRTSEHRPSFGGRLLELEPLQLTYPAPLQGSTDPRRCAVQPRRTTSPLAGLLFWRSSPNRIPLEIRKAISAPKRLSWIRLRRRCQALERPAPEVPSPRTPRGPRLAPVPRPVRWHPPEGSTRPDHRAETAPPRKGIGSRRARFGGVSVGERPARG